MRRLIPEFASRGRAELDRQVPNARAIGEMAVTHFRSRLSGTSDQRSRTRTSDAPRQAEHAASPPMQAEELAIPDYDSLSAVQVVPRLDGLTAEELVDIESYESALRRRRTILNRVAQLRS